MRGGPVSRILSTPDRDPGLDGHSSRPAVAGGLKLPTRVPRAEAALPAAVSGGRARNPYSALLPVGLAVPVRLPVPRWALTPPFHPCHDTLWRSVFCGTVRHDQPVMPRYYLASCPWSPDFPRPA